MPAGLRSVPGRARSLRGMSGLVLFPLLLLTLPACESEVATPEEIVFEEGELTLNASSRTDVV